MTGRPRKSAAQKKAEGILRSRDKPQVEAEEAFALDPVRSVDSPDWLPPTLVPIWRAVTADLCAMGAIVPGDLVLLDQAFRMLANTITIQALLDSVLEGDGDGVDVAQVAKLSGALVAQEAAYERILGKFGITPSERARLLQSLPRRKKDDGKKTALDFIKAK